MSAETGSSLPEPGYQPAPSGDEPALEAPSASEVLPAAEQPSQTQLSTQPTPAPAVPAVSEAPASVQPAQASPANGAAFDMDDFVAVMERVSRRLSSPDGQTGAVASPSPTPVAPPEDPQSPANPAIEE
jgi:hypothetical protein